MSESNKTELPTPKRLEKAKEDGNFHFSDAIVHTLTLAMGVVACYWVLADLPQRFDRSLHNAIILGQNPDFPTAAKHFLFVMLKEFLPPVAIIFGVISFFAIVGNIIQVGFVFQGAKFKKGLQSISPVTNAKNLFSKHTISNFFMQLFKVIIICWVCYQMITNDVGLSDRIYRHRLDIFAGFWEIAQISFKVLLTAVICLVPVSIIDYWVKGRLYVKDNMMSHDEITREHKESEGDPHVKAERKSIGKQMVEGDGLGDRMQNASAVIRNPTHIAVVVRFEPSASPVPYIMDMQSEEKALALIERAVELKIPLYEDIEFARAIWSSGEVNRHIPLELSAKIVTLTYWLQEHHPEKVFQQPEFKEIHTRIGDVKR